MYPHSTFNFQDALLHAWNIQEILGTVTKEPNET